MHLHVSLAGNTDVSIIVLPLCLLTTYICHPPAPYACQLLCPSALSLLPQLWL